MCIRESLHARHIVHIVEHYAAAHNMHEKSVSTARRRLCQTAISIKHINLTYIFNIVIPI